MRAVDNNPDGLRLRGVIVVPWRAGLRISKALALAKSDLDRGRGGLLARLASSGEFYSSVGRARRVCLGLDCGDRVGGWLNQGTGSVAGD